MHALAKKPAAVLGTTAMIALGATGLSSITAQARSSSSATGTTPTSPERGRGVDTAALAKQLGVTETQLQTALAAVRTELGTTDRSTDLKAEAQAIADSLGVDVATITGVFEAQIGSAAKRADRPAATTPSADAARPTTPPAGGNGKGAKGKGRPDQTKLIAALVKATGKTDTQVKAALAAGRTAHEKAEAARQAEFAALLAAKLGLETSKVTAALDAVKPVRPAQNAKTATTTS